MSEKYELSLPFTPLGPPSKAYLDGWERIWGRRRAARGARKGAGGGGSPPRRNPSTPMGAATPPHGPDPQERPVNQE